MFWSKYIEVKENIEKTIGRVLYPLIIVERLVRSKKIYKDLKTYCCVTMNIP